MLNIKIIFKYAFKDLSRQKVRTIIGILGIMISVALLSIVLILSDSISVTFIDYLSIDAGNQDMVISVRHYNGEPEDRSNYFEYAPIIDSIQGNIEGIDAFIPRMELWGNVNISQGVDTPELTNATTSVLISGINFSLENQLGFGSFVKQETNELLNLNNLPLNHCAIYYKFNEEIKYAKNDMIEIRMRLIHGNITYYQEVNFTIDAVFDFQFKWPIRYENRPLIVVDIESLYEIFGNSTFFGKCDNLILTLESGNSFYDARDIEGSENRVKDIAGEIQLLIGINEFFIDLPKLEVLGFSEFLSVGITIIFVFVSMISMLISGVLINGILKTSVEERIREFGIFRTLGATKKYNLSIVLVQGLLLCNFGTISGIFVAILATRFIILPIAEIIVAQGIPGLVGNISFFFTIWSILISYFIGIAVGLIVSISPAIKVMQLQLIESIHPYRHEDTLYHLQKKASVNYKLIIVGIILAANGAFVLLVMPRILISGNISLMAGTLIALLIIFLVGTTLAGLGIMPLILRFFIQTFRLISRKLYNVIRIFVFRYQRRNSSTIIIFAFTFSFVIFTAAATRFLSDQVAIGANLRYGSDLVIETIGWAEGEDVIEDPFGGPPISLQNNPILELQNNDYSVNPNRILTTDFENDILNVEGIEKISSVIASPFHLTQIYSEEGKEFIAEIGDYAGLFTQEISLIGIDEEYPSTIKTKYIEFTQGDLSTSFNQIFNIEGHYKCIISEGLSENLDLNKDDLVRFNIQRGDESQIYTFQIAGVAASMPGFFSEFGRSSASAQMGGVMISDGVYLEIMDIPPIPYLDKIFIKLSSNRQRSNQQIIDEINSDGIGYDFDITDVEREVTQQQSLFSILDTFFTMTLDATIVICLFGLISSSYSTIIERKKDIGIIRTLGLKGKEINRLFTIESLIIMLSSGTVGVIVGWLTGLLLSTSINLLSDLPNIPTFPLTNMLSVYIISIIFVLIGMKLLLRNIRKKKIVEIYRETM
ncbi:MAG: FtsX-like permease family protein [Candidatus Thorarchaeota archaeon]